MYENKNMIQNKRRAVKLVFYFVIEWWGTLSLFPTLQLLKKFGKNVKIERIKKDLTQEQFAEILDVNSNYIACIECGRQNMSLGKILELAKALNVDIETLLKFSN